MFRVDQLTADFDSQPNPDSWLAALKRAQSRELPPKGKPRPADKDVQAFSKWLADGQSILDAVGDQTRKL